MEFVSFATAFLAGVLSIASPCVLPLLPGVMAYSTKSDRLTPFAIVLGLTLTFTVLGIASAMFGALLFEYIDWIKLISGILIIIMGLYMLFEPVENFILRLWQHVPLSKVSLANAEEGGLTGGFLLGASLGIVWMPCIGPILASILMIVAQQGNMAYGAALLIVYSLGLGIPMLIIAVFSHLVSDKVRAASKYSLTLRRVAGAILVLVGLYFISAIVPYFIDY